MATLKNLILYAIFRVIFFITNILPEKGRYILGKSLGQLIYYLVRSRRKIARKNLKTAYEDIKEEKLKSLTRKTFINMGLMLIEFIYLEKIDKDNFKDYCSIEGEEYLKEAFSRGKGVIIYGAHFGNWEWMAAFISLLGYPLNAIATRQENSFFNKKINEIRGNKGINIIPYGILVKNGYRKLENGECLYILGDQDARNNGWKINFFGKPASTYTGAVKLAQRTGAAIVPTFLIRENWGHHKLIFKKMKTVPDDFSVEEQKDLLQRLISITEDIIDKHPEQWFWVHRRWKT